MENGETSDTYVEYRLPPPRRIKQRRDRTDFLLREGSSREEIGKWLKNKSIPWQWRRRLLQVVTGTFPCGQQMVKYGYKKTAECTLCKKTHEESGSSWSRERQRRQLAIFRVRDAWDKRK
jgi:hypothetical protein